MTGASWTIVDYLNEDREIIMEFREKYLESKNDDLILETAEKLIHLYDQITSVDLNSDHKVGKLSAKQWGLMHLASVGTLKRYRDDGNLKRVKHQVKSYAGLNGPDYR